MQNAIQKIRSIDTRYNVVTAIKNGNHYRNLIVNGKIVSSLEVYDLTTSLGTTGIRTAGIGNVATSEEHQGNGYMKILMKDSVDYIKNEGFHTSTLIGIPHFYHKFDFVVNMPLYKQKLDFDFIHPVSVDMSNFCVSPIQETDYAEVISLFNSNNLGRPGTIIRDISQFNGFRRGSEIGTTAEASVLRTNTGKFIGYFVSDKAESTFTISELETVNSSTYYQIMDHFQKIGNKRELHDIDFVMAQDHPFISFIKRYGTTEEVEYPQNGMMMSRISNLIPLMETMVPELQDRLQKRHGKYSGALTVVTDLATFTLEVNEGVLSLSTRVTESKLIISKRELIQLLSGYRELDDILITPNNTIICDNEELASILHPQRTPFLWPTDHY